MISKKTIKNFIALRNLNWLIAFYQRCVLNALYYNKVQKQNRLSILRDMDWNYKTWHIYSNSPKEKMLIILLKFRFYKLYDSVRTLAAQI